MRHTRKEFLKKLDIAAETILMAFGNREVLSSLDEFESQDNVVLLSLSEISREETLSIIDAIFGDLGSITTWMFRPPCVYLDLDQIQALKKVIRRLRRNVETVVDTVYVLRDIGAYYAWLALHFNRGILGHKTALQLLMVSARLYDICQRMLPYVFDEIQFGEDVCEYRVLTKEGMA